MEAPQKPLREWLDELHECVHDIEMAEDLLRILPARHQYEMQEATNCLRITQARHTRVLEQLRVLDVFQNGIPAVAYGPGGWHVVWHDTDHDLVSYWYGPKEACETRAKEPPPTLDKFFPLERS